VPEALPIRLTVMSATVDVAATGYEVDDSATIASPASELFEVEPVLDDDVAPSLAAFDAEPSFAPPQAARKAISAQSAARLRVVECMLMFLWTRPVVRAASLS